jgi:hypothetical protein
MKSARVFLWAAVAFGLVAACGGSTGGAPSSERGGLDSSNPVADGSMGSTGADAVSSPGPGAADAAGTGQGQGQGASNGGDCTSCAAPTPVCCASQNGATCVADSSACPAGTMVVACIGAAGCGGGKTCCENGGATSCATACPAGHQVCQASSECPPALPVCDMNGVGMDSGYGVCAARSSSHGDSGGQANEGGNMQPADAGGSQDVSTPTDGAPPFEAGAAG